MKDRGRKRSKHLIYIMWCINKLLKPPLPDGCEWHSLLGSERIRQLMLPLQDETSSETPEINYAVSFLPRQAELCQIKTNYIAKVSKSNYEVCISLSNAYSVCIVWKSHWNALKWALKAIVCLDLRKTLSSGASKKQHR